MDERTVETNIINRQQQLLNRPNPALDVMPWSMYRDSAGEMINPQTGTKLP